MLAGHLLYRRRVRGTAAAPGGPARLQRPRDSGTRFHPSTTAAERYRVAFSGLRPGVVLEQLDDPGAKGEQSKHRARVLAVAGPLTCNELVASPDAVTTEDSQE